jgi:hypothetical protein
VRGSARSFRVPFEPSSSREILGPSLERQRIGLTEELKASGDWTAPSVNESETEAQMLWTKLCILAPMALCTAACRRAGGRRPKGASLA